MQATLQNGPYNTVSLLFILMDIVNSWFPMFEVVVLLESTFTQYEADVLDLCLWHPLGSKGCSTTPPPNCIGVALFWAAHFLYANASPAAIAAYLTVVLVDCLCRPTFLLSRMGRGDLFLRLPRDIDRFLLMRNRSIPNCGL